MTLRVFAPASVGNFIVGFDCLGAAVCATDVDSNWRGGDELELHMAAQAQLECSGPYAAYLPNNGADNLVQQCYQLFQKTVAERDVAPSHLHLHLHKHLPVASGLGSSAASVVAAFFGLNTFYGLPFSDNEILTLCGQIEGGVSGALHYDNIAPCLRGGLQLMLPDKERLSVRLPTPDWHLVLCYPGVALATKTARAVLPATYTLAQVTGFAERLAAFVASMQAHDFYYAAQLLRDDIAEPHRAALVPGFANAKQAALQAGAIAFSLSGAGPTCIAVCRDAKTAASVRAAVLSALPAQPEKYAVLARIDERGARVLPTINAAPL